MAQVWLDLKRWPIKACNALITTGDKWIQNKIHFLEEPMRLFSNLFLNLTIFLNFFILTDTFFLKLKELVNVKPTILQKTYCPPFEGKFCQTFGTFSVSCLQIFCFYSMTACVWAQLHTPMMAYKPVCDLSVCLYMQVHRLRERWAPTIGRPPCPLAISVPSLPLRRLRNDLGR